MFAIKCILHVYSVGFPTCISNCPLYCCKYTHMYSFNSEGYEHANYKERASFNHA